MSGGVYKDKENTLTHLYLFYFLKVRSHVVQVGFKLAM